MDKYITRICLWPCGTWAYSEDLDEYQWMSDDFEVIEIEGVPHTYEIECVVERRIQCINNRRSTNDIR